MSNLFALLVGINGYPVKPLQGCINDITAVEDYLNAVYGSSSDVKLNVKRLTDVDEEEPTRENIIKGFDHFSKAKAGDTCLFYYSGHGSYSPAPTEFWTDSNGFVQSFVCIDSRTPGGRDLMDKEMGFLIWKTVRENPGINFVAITDCCHSGTITKNIDDSGITDRMCPGDSVITKVEDYLGFNYSKNGESAYAASVDGHGNRRITVKQGEHIHIAASRDNQTSKELVIDGVRRGAFTHSLLKTLYTNGGNIGYKNLINRTSILVRNLVPDQNPDVNINGELNAKEKNKIFLNQQFEAKDQKFLVYRDPKYGWCVQAGSIHGVSIGDKVNIEAIGETTITGTNADFSTVIDKTAFGTSDKTYMASIKRQLIQPISISFGTNVPLNVQNLIQSSSTTTSLVTVSKENSGQFIIRFEAKHTFVTKPGEEQPLFNPLPITNKDEADFFIEQLESICRWVKIQELNNPSTELTNEHYTVKLFRDTIPENSDPSTFEEIKDIESITDVYYKYEDNKRYQPAIKISISNNLPDNSLWITSAYLAFDYSIGTEYFKPMEIAAGKEVWMNLISEGGLANDIIPVQLDERYEKLGYSEIVEYLKLFIGITKIDVDFLAQDGVDLAPMKDRHEKGFGVEKSPTVFSSNAWKTETLGFRIIKPAQGKKIMPGKATTLNGFTIAQHSTLEATVRLTSSENINRNEKSVAPPHSARYNSYLEPFDMLPGSRSGITTDVLELFDVNNRDAVTPEQPLVIETAGSRSPDDGSVLPIGYDPETKLYYPLGYMDEDQNIIIETLPDDTPSDAAINEKSLLGSIKIYFQKVIGQKLGFKYKYPRLAKVTVSKDLKVAYNDDATVISSEVAKANTIILFIHGIIGDTEEMVKCIKTNLDPGGHSLEKMCDLVLAFDYENLNTKIEENAKLMKEKLEAVGLKEGHGKNLIVIAHSMGGLLSRWMIEKLGGNKQVSKLVMLGTPNNGTPWADVRDLAEALLTYAINGAAFLKPWMFLLSGLGKLAKGTQVTFKQMDSQTGIYKELNMGVDPGLQYVIVGGNTKLIDPGFDKTANLIQRLFKKIKKRGVYDALDLALFKKPNDIAVSVDSIETLIASDKWGKKPVVNTVASDHLNYFLTLDAIKNIN
jgi:pimeloyl-ACP methyl ester carboxylesterase